MDNYTTIELKQLSLHNDAIKCHPLEDIRLKGSWMGSLRGEEPCSKWIYESDNGFQSMTSEVCCSSVQLQIETTLPAELLNHPIAISINDHHPLKTKEYNCLSN